MPKRERRKDAWMWSVVEAGLVMLEYRDRETVLSYFVEHGVPMKVALRVLNRPERRRKL